MSTDISRWSRNSQNPIFVHLFNEILAYYGTPNVLLRPDEPTTGPVRATLFLYGTLQYYPRSTLQCYKRTLPSLF